MCITRWLPTKEDEVERSCDWEYQQPDVESFEQQRSAWSKHHVVQQFQHCILQLLLWRAEVSQLLCGQRHLRVVQSLWVLNSKNNQSWWFLHQSLFYAFNHWTSFGKCEGQWKPLGKRLVMAPCLRNVWGKFLHCALLHLPCQFYSLTLAEEFRVCFSVGTL